MDETFTDDSGEKRIRRLARDLQPGDDIHFGRTVVRVYNQGTKIPKRKCLIIYTDKHGNERRTFWNQYTRITLPAKRDK